MRFRQSSSKRSFCSLSLRRVPTAGGFKHLRHGFGSLVSFQQNKRIELGYLFLHIDHLFGKAVDFILGCVPLRVDSAYALPSPRQLKLMLLLKAIYVVFVQVRGCRRQWVWDLIESI